ncbi:MAG: hypothetical protein IJG23_06625 [Clostridia bacterium]|nr:hypothetical protein [Clostridia bacterium]
MKENQTFMNNPLFEEDIPYTYSYEPFDITNKQLLLNENNLNSIADELLIPNSTHFYNDEVIDIQFEESVQHADKWDYLIAACSGALCAALDIFWVKELLDPNDVISSLENARNWGSEKSETFVIMVAQKKAGYKGNNIRGAIEKLEEAFPMATDKLTDTFGGGKQHHLRDFAHHPSIIGLIFSLLSQFTEKGFGTDVTGKFITQKLPKDALIGKTFFEKVYYATIQWAMHLISDMAGSNSSPGKGTGIPGPLLSFFKEVSCIPFVQKMSKTDEKGINAFSKQISKWFNGTYFRDEAHPKGIRFDLRTEIGLAHEFSKQFVPVIINECIVRGFYFVHYLYLDIKNNDVNTIDDLKKLNPEHFLPFKNRVVTRMCTVSSGVFTTIDIAGAAVKSIAESDGDKSAFVVNFFLNINYPGIGRFVFACVADSKYIYEDISNAYKTYKARIIEERLKGETDTGYFELTLNQSRILQSLKYQKTLFDISNTQDDVQICKKRAWLEDWKNFIIENLNLPTDYFIEDEDELYQQISEELQNNEDCFLYQIIIELLLFIPFFPLSVEHQKQCKGIKYHSKYETQIFCLKQNTIDSETVNTLKRLYGKNISILKKQKEKMAISIAASVVITIVSGGLALNFAPAIAIAIAGESFAGLSGAALTSASLAAIGGGSLAAGGLGMAGGTAIITGGGALLAATGSSVATISSSLLMTSKRFALKECSTLLTFCKYILVDRYHDYAAIDRIIDSLDKKLEALQNSLKQVEEESSIPEKEKKKLMKETKESIKYIKRCINELNKMIQ